MSQEYIEQYERMKRWYYRLKPSNVFSSNGNRDDFYYAFFITCYHLKDWLIKKSGVNSNVVENYIKNSTPLSICADLCIYFKHTKIISARHSPDTKGERQGIAEMSNGLPTVMCFDCKITSKGKIYDAFKLAEDCIEEWDKFLKNNLLPIPELLEEKIFQCFENEQ